MRVIFRILRWSAAGLALFYLLHVVVLSRRFLVSDTDHEKELNSLVTLLRFRKPTEENLLMRFTDIFETPKQLKWRTGKLKEIHDYIYTTLDRLQYEGDCKTKKIIRCQNSIVSEFGSIVHRYVICLHIAFALNRTFFIQQPEFKNFNGIGEFTRVDETNCPHLAAELPTITNRCNFKDYDCYIDKDGLEINNTYRLLEFTREADFPAPKYIPGTIPRNIEKALVILGVVKPWHWFTSQLLGYLMMRPNKSFKERFERTIDKNSLRHPIVGIHFRSGDGRKGEDVRLISEKSYIKKVDEIFTSRIKSSKNRSVYVTSNDRRTTKNTVELLNSSYVVTYSRTLNNIHASTKRDDFARSTMENAMLDLYLLVHCDFAVATFSSNLGRLVWELRTSQFPYLEASETVISVDQNMFYSWYDFSVNTPYQLSIISNNKTVVFGKDTIIPYKKGQLFISSSSRNKKLVSSDGVRVKAKFGQLRSSKVRAEGYLYANHFVSWPGDVVYMNDIEL